MTTFTFRQVLLAIAALFTFLAILPHDAQAASADYKLEVIEQPVKAGKGAAFSVKISHTADGKVLSGAQIGDAKLHMPMGKMDMPAPVKFVEQDGNGFYRFSGDLTMYGEWVLDLSVTVPQEQSPVQASLKFQVVK